MLLATLTVITVGDNVSLDQTVRYSMYAKLNLLPANVTYYVNDTQACTCKLKCWWDASCTVFSYVPATAGRAASCSFSTATAVPLLLQPDDLAYTFLKQDFNHKRVLYNQGARTFVYVDVNVDRNHAQLFCPRGASVAILSDANVFKAVQDGLEELNLPSPQRNVWVNAANDGTQWAWADGTVIPGTVGTFPWAPNFPLANVTLTQAWMAPSQKYLLVNRALYQKAAVLCEMTVV
ncbi:uncharacterized protein LOC125177745 [Hyalella azteca]|uniref:Uncharacterized protein LOC125177745 n=1 Tax=Hyalella azteca TaxID=294128 RepID=A0A979FH11_HYAAZ|nr:uncharacterized protein LOC125177745 [Hyalella azteca]